MLPDVSKIGVCSTTGVGSTARAGVTGGSVSNDVETDVTGGSLSNDVGTDVIGGSLSRAFEVPPNTNGTVLSALIGNFGVGGGGGVGLGGV